MRCHIVVRLGPSDRASIAAPAGEPQRTLDVRPDVAGLRFGMGQILGEMATRGLRPTEVGVDLLVLAVAVQAADTRISRVRNAEDSFTREIALWVPVSDPTLWSGVADLIERMLGFLSGDIWRVFFRSRPDDGPLAPAPLGLPLLPFDRVALFSGGVDSFVGATDLLASGSKTLFVSHYWDAGTSSQAACVRMLDQQFGAFGTRHVRARVGVTAGDMASLGSEDTQRARSFLFLALAAAGTSAMPRGSRVVDVPENGLISLNVPLDPLRVGAWSTRTTHPFYLARWQELLRRLDLAENVENRYRFRTKGQMLDEVARRSFVEAAMPSTISCSSVSKARWEGRPPGHCGYCVPCLIRRAAEVHAYGYEPTTYLDLPVLGGTVDPRGAKGEHVRSFEFMAQRLRRKPETAVALVRKPGPLTDYAPGEIRDYTKVFAEGIDEVGRAIGNLQSFAP
ncbi:MAG: Qat anti-phage system QueC-like protein QatC [Microvirga sp.]|jgi:hypothetical protein|nr:hypothetical protein ASF28_19160 [Methylobacterium sp. Leaf99]KQQ13857.1 hypothetical protein ASF59_20470 [Methylobacterium sp. Leaf121]KQT49128.1 hypothetical protein ASG52_09120 [Methylobacterium sp. Leaf456]GJD72694.1 hypothetical protein CFIICLFH_0914 [Methylobacterium goesingense]